MPDQYWGDETFDDGSPAYGSSPQLYLTVEPFSTSPETTTGRSLRVADGHLYDYVQQLSGRTDGLAAPLIGTGTDGDAVWFVERQNVVGDSDVKISPGIAPLSGVPDNDTFKHIGVCSHVSGGTLTSAGEDEYFTDVTGYFLIEEKQAAANHRVLLLQLASGAITVLGDQQVKDIDSQHAAGNAFDYFAPRPLRLSVEDAGGGQHRVRAYRRVSSGEEVQLFDGSAFLRTAIADGRCGFGLQTRRTTSGGCDCVGFVNEFTVRNQAKTSLLFNDRFERTQRLAARRLGSTSIGRSLSQAWTGDLQSTSSPAARSIAGQLKRDTSVAGQVLTGANISGTTADYPGFYMRQDSPRQRGQHVEMTFVRLNNHLGFKTEMGCLLRFNVQAFGVLNNLIEMRGKEAPSGGRVGGFRTGYAVLVVHDTSATPTWELQIRHFDGTPDVDDAGSLIAKADLSGFSLAVGSPIVIDTEIRNFDGTSIGQGGFVSILTKVNTVTVTPVPESAFAGVAEQDDYLVDTRSEATTDKGGWGMYLFTDTLGADELVALRSFGSLALTDGPTIPPDEQASVSIASEVASKSGSLTVTPEATISETIITQPIVHRMESGKTQVITRQPKGRRRWKCTARMARDEYEAIDALYASNGSHTPFDWTHPYTGVTYVVMFGDEELTFEELFIAGGAAAYQVSFELDELFAQSTYNLEL